MAIPSTAITLVGNESGSWVDGFWGWAGDRATGAVDGYVDRWLSDQFPEAAAPFNPDEAPDNVTVESSASGGGWLGDSQNQQLLLYAGIGLLALVLLR